MRFGKHIVTSTHIARSNTAAACLSWDSAWCHHTRGIFLVSLDIGYHVLYHILHFAFHHNVNSRNSFAYWRELGQIHKVEKASHPRKPQHVACRSSPRTRSWCQQTTTRRSWATAPTTDNRREVAAAAVAARRHPPSRQRCPALLARVMARFLRGQEIGLQRSWISRPAFRRTWKTPFSATLPHKL